MANKAVVDAVMARLGATWNGISVVEQNTTDEPPADGSPYIVVQFPVANTERSVVDRRLYREEGGFRVVLNAIRGAGLTDPLTWADDLAELFRGRSFAGVETQAPDTAIDDETGNYLVVAISVPYRFHFIG